MAINTFLSLLLFFVLRFIFESMSPDRLAIESNFLNGVTACTMVLVGVMFTVIALYGILSNKKSIIFDTVSFIGPVVLCVGLAMLTVVT